jgi:hypothetical protein
MSTGFWDWVVENAGNRMWSTSKGIDLLETVIDEKRGLPRTLSNGNAA